MGLSNNKIVRFFKNLNAGSFGIIASITMVIAELLSLLSLVLSKSYENGFYELFITAINVLFYLSIGRYFFKSKNYDDLRSIAIALGILAIFDYVVPSIEMLINGAIVGGLGFATLGILLSGAVIGILYFVFLILDMKRKMRNPYIFLIIFGALLLALNIAYAAFTIIGGLEIINLLNGAELETSEFAAYIISCISMFLIALANVLYGVVYLLYPILKSRKEKRGY